MKSINKILSSFTTSFHLGQIVNAVLDRGIPRKIEPCIYTDVTCPICNGKKGFPIRDRENIWWSCKDLTCIQLNAKNGIAPKSKEVPITDLLARSGVPRFLQHATFDDWRHDNSIKNALMGWLRKPQGFCILSGDRGRGKSYMACCVISHQTRFNGDSARFLDVVETKYQWLDEMRSDGFKTLPTKMTQCDLLVIDDIDKVKQSDAFHEFIYLVVNARYAAMKPTVITTNSSFTKLEEIMGPAISSRLFAKESLLVEVEGEDLRQ